MLLHTFELYDLRAKQIARQTNIDFDKKSFLLMPKELNKKKIEKKKLMNSIPTRFLQN